ncbi:copine family protein 1-like isoform X2 [Littorina saxatilis]|uniref:VWFA domain-containing protein n=1 Tax=Littorina saxatilis TaxID=31220 RepID=A0AAN9AUB5_9CAEN
MEPETIFIVVVIVVVLLLLCLRRRRRRVVGVAGSGVGAEQEVKEEMSSSSSVHTESIVKSNSVLKLFKKNDVNDLMHNFKNLDDVSDAIRKAGLESCNLIFGIDYTGSNYMQGKKTFGGKCLHHIDPAELNPYQKVICIMGETLEPFAEDGHIPTFGFGDTYTRDHSVFSLSSMAPCRGFQDVLKMYNEMTPKVRLGGPTNFAPLIRQAIDIVSKNRSFHILVIVADGQVTAERDTTAAIVQASNYPLSIIMVGVGDGPWDMMRDFDDKLPARRFDNFRFVNFNQVTNNVKSPQAAFALQALMEIPDQYKAIRRLGLMEFTH